MRNAKLHLLQQPPRPLRRVLQVWRERLLPLVSSDPKTFASDRQRAKMNAIARTLKTLEGLTKVTIDTSAGDHIMVVGWQDGRVVYSACVGRLNS